MKTMKDFYAQFDEMTKGMTTEEKFKIASELAERSFMNMIYEQGKRETVKQ